tara:strand:+ start:1292 stop:1660 length:369 start_codon:yes stop_codon:yes gene_type:complete
MGISYQFLAERNLLIATATGTITPADNAQSNLRVKTELDNHPGLKLMVDMRAAEVAATPVAVMAMMDAFFDLVGNRVVVAIITAGAAGDPNSMLAETKAFIAGAPMQVFETPDAAFAWLTRR